MKKQQKIFFLILLLATLWMGLAIVSGMKQDTVEDTFLLYKVSDATSIQSIENTYALQWIDQTKSGISKFKVTENTDVNLLLSKGFAFNHESSIQRPPWQRVEDPYLKDQYALSLMNVHDAWQITLGEAFVKVAIIDTGIDTSHDEFKGRISMSSYNSVTQQVGLNAVIDDHGHGTMVAGIIGALKDNSKGIAGIAQHIELLIIKANKPSEGRFDDIALIEGIYYAVDQGAHIINLSLGGSYRNPLTEQAISYARANDVIVIAAAGNDATSDLMYPAAFKDSLSISAIDAQKSLAAFSNFGDTIDFTAPGAQIITTSRNNGYATVNGTSFSAPQVAGVIALLKSHLGPLSYDEVVQRLKLTVQDLGPQGKDIYFGYGLLDAWSLLTKEVISITFETFEGSTMDQQFVLANHPFYITSSTHLTDHQFQGWYLDALFLEPFIEGETILNQDTILYAFFNPAFHTVYLSVFNNIINEITVEHNQAIEIEDLHIEGYHFYGWFIDDLFQDIYDGQPISKDMILYAYLEEIKWITVTLYGLDLEFIKTHLIEQGKTFELEDPILYGYTFYGWYKDVDYKEPFTEFNSIKDLNLYALFLPEPLTITLMINEDIFDVLNLFYDDVPALPTPHLQNAYFIDWFYDQAFNQRFESIPLKSSIILYGQVVEQAFEINYFFGNELYQTIWIESGKDFLDLSVDIVGYTFYGWFFDQSFNQIADDSIKIYEDLNVYGFIEMEIYHIQFFDYDQVTLIFDQFINMSEAILYMDGPEKPATSWLSFEFISWSESLIYPNSDLKIYPIYAPILDITQASINPNVDTIYEMQIWEDSGININDPEIEIITTSDLNTDMHGRYQVTYCLYYENILLHCLIRNIRVLKGTGQDEVFLNPAIDTVIVGNQHQDTGVLSPYELISITSNVNTLQSGVYQILYQVDIDGFYYEKVRYVHVIDHDFSDYTIEVLRIKTKEDEQ